jgi:LmbE family N-acetylglucosaminyl deacetylase
MKAIVGGVRITTMTAVVAFHAHPDDEVLLTGGTLARLAAQGHRVVIVMPTDGDMREATGRRLSQLRKAVSRPGET